MFFAFLKAGTIENEGAMISKPILWMMFLFLVWPLGGCGKEKEGQSVDKNPLEEYAGTLVDSLSKAKKARLKASIPTIRLRINQFKQDTGRYPDTLEELNIPDLPVQWLQYDSETGEVDLRE